MREIADPAGTDAVVLGAGGAASAIVAELALAGARRVTVVNRSVGRAEKVSSSIGGATGVDCVAAPLTTPWPVPATADVVVQATRVGMDDADARLPLDWSAARAGAIAADVVIDPPRTAFLREAEAAGLRTLDGLGMLVSQAVLGLPLVDRRRAGGRCDAARARAGARRNAATLTASQRP